TGQCHFLDWQRTRQRRRISWRVRVRNLAALDATLAEAYATERERLACVSGYLAACTLGERWGSSPPSVPPAQARRLARDVRRHASRLLCRRHVRKERASPPPVEGQGILWLDGEALCVTHDFWRTLAGEV